MAIVSNKGKKCVNCNFLLPSGSVKKWIWIMIKLLIVDDERTIRNGLTNHIDWNSLGISMVQSSESAQEALSVCEILRPDIVLSDIRMRGMGGIEMCTQIHQKYKNCQIIFVSGYSDKEYLKAAISLGAVDYIEKPVSPELLTAAVRKAVNVCVEQQKQASADETLEESRSLISQRVLLALARGDYPENFDKNMEMSGLFTRDYEAYRFCVLRTDSSVTNLSAVHKELCAFLESLPPVEDGTVFGTFLNERNFCILLSGSEAGIDNQCPFLQALEERVCGLTVCGKRFFLSVGCCVKDRLELHRSYEFLQQAMRALFFKGWGQYTCEATQPVTSVGIDKTLLNSFTSAFSKHDRHGAAEALTSIYDLFAAQTEADPEQIRSIYYSLDYLMQTEYERRSFPGDGECGYASGCVGKIQAIETLSEIHSFLLARADHMIELCQRFDDNGSAVQSAIRLMHENFADKDLSVKTLADSVYLTPTYLSGLFKKRTGKTIGQYLTELRIGQSMQLLKNKQLKLYHIAEMVGYDDPNYYAKIFKRHIGMTPSEYREKNLL